MNAYVEGANVPRSVLILDNCAIHKALQYAIRSLADLFGVRVEFLSPYELPNPPNVSLRCARRSALLGRGPVPL